MIKVITSVHKSQDPDNNSWRVHTCRIDFGIHEGPIVFSPAAAYPSPEAAHAASRAEALEQIRSRGHTDPEDDIIWKLAILP